MPHVYKICAAADWRAAEETGIYHGSADDARDGFIHLSASRQLRATAERHFHGLDDLVLVTFEEAAMPALRWEVSRGGDLFPHVYGALPTVLARRVTPLPWDGAAHVFPDCIPP